MFTIRDHQTGAVISETPSREVVAQYTSHVLPQKSEGSEPNLAAEIRPEAPPKPQPVSQQSSSTTPDSLNPVGQQTK